MPNSRFCTPSAPPSQATHYIGLDVHKRMIRYCVTDGSGTIRGEGTTLLGVLSPRPLVKPGYDGLHFLGPYHRSHGVTLFLFCRFCAQS